MMEIRHGLRSTGVGVPTGTGVVPTGTGGMPAGATTGTSVPVMGLESVISNHHDR
jgi:hypothetical protein